MSKCDCKKFSDLLDAIYKVGLNWSDWGDVLEYFSSLVKNGKGAITVRQNDTGEIDINNFYLAKTWGFSADVFESYRREHYKNDIWTDLEWKHPAEKVCIFSDHLTKRNLLQTDFYKNFLKPLKISDGLSIQLFRSNNIRVVLNILHDDNTESVLELYRVLENVMPHLCRAATMHMKLLGINSGSEYRNQAEQLEKKYGFTPREIEVATASVYLGTNKKIAQALGVTEGTIKKQIPAILRKMELTQKDQIAYKLMSFITPELELIPPIIIRELEKAS